MKCSWKIFKSFLHTWKALSDNPCHELVAKRQKKLQAFVVPPSPDFKVVFLQACWKKHWCRGEGGGGPEKGIFISNDSFATIYGKDCRLKSLFPNLSISFSVINLSINYGGKYELVYSFKDLGKQSFDKQSEYNRY